MIREIYKRLLRRYGRQGWWPVTPLSGGRPEYAGGPRTEEQRFEVIIGSILTQNTSWKNVERALAVLQQRGWLDPVSLLGAEQDDLARAVYSAGYYNQKAARLKAAAELLLEHPLSELEQLATAEIRCILLAVNGIGPETADSILLYGLQRPVFVVDAYTRRIFSRIGLCSAACSYVQLQSMFHDSLPRSQRLFNEYHALIVAHGKDGCRKNPRCSKCVLQELCRRQGVAQGERR